MKRCFFVLAVLLAGCSNDYDVVCSYFEELSRHPEIGEFSKAEKDAFIRNRIKNLDEDSEARMLWENMRYFSPPSERYAFYRQGVAEMQGIENWHCEAMKKLAATAIDPEYAPTKEVKVEDAPGVVLESEADWGEQ